MSENLVNGVKDLAASMLLFIVSSVIGLVGFVGAVAVTHAAAISIESNYTVYAGSGSLTVHIYPSYVAFSSFIRLISALALVAAIPMILAILRLRRGFRLLREVNAVRYGIGYTGSLLYLIGTAVAVVGIVIMLTGFTLINEPAAPGSIIPPQSLMVMLVSGVVIMIGAVSGAVGEVLLVIALFRLGSDNRSGMVEAGSILFILIDLVGAALIYAGLRGILRKPGAAWT